MKRPKIDYNNFFKDESGTVIIVVAVLMVVLLGMTAMAVDVGDLYQNRREMVNAADAAAMAGVQHFLETDDKAEIEKYARDFAIDNYGCNAALVEAEADMTEYTVLVRTGRSVDHTFAPILGIHSSDVTAEAKAIIRKAVEMEGLIPIHVQKSMFDIIVGNSENSTHNYVQFHQEHEQPGNWGWVSFHGQGETAEVTVSYLRDGYPDPLPIGHEFNSNTGDNIYKGNRKQDVIKILGDYKDEGTILYIPVTHDVEGNRFTGNENLIIKGFAAIRITDFYIDGPKNSFIEGELVENELVDQPQGSVFGGDFDLRSIFLTNID